MARKLRVEIDGDSRGGRDALDGVADEADKAARATDKLGKQFQETARKSTGMRREIDNLGDEARAAARDIDRLNDELKDSLGAAVKAGLAYRDASGKVRDLQGRYLGAARAGRLLAGEHENSVKRIGDSLKKLPGLGVTGFMESLKGLSTLANAAGPIGTGALVAGAVAGAPVALAAGGGAVLAGGAIGAVGGGVAGAAMGPAGAAVTDAWDSALADLKARFIDATTGYVGPAVDAIDIIADAIKGIPLEETFKAAEKYVEPLARGVAGLLGNAASGLDNLVKDAEPVIGMLERKLPELGDDIGDSMEIAGMGADGAAEALGDVLTVVGGLTKAAAGAVAGFGQLYEKAIDTPVLEQGHELFLELFDFQDLPEQAARSLKGVSDATGAVTRSAQEAKAAVDALNDAFNRQFDVVTGSIEANLQFEEAQDRLTEGFKRGKDAWEASTQTGRDNIKLAEDYVIAADRQRQAAIAAGDGSALSTAKANLAFQEQVRQLEGTLVKLGLNKTAAHAFVQEFLKIDGMTANATVIVDVSWQDRLPRGISMGNLMRAEGGPVAAGQPYIVGDGGRPEVFVPDANGEIIPSIARYNDMAMRTRNLVQQMYAGSGSGGGQRAGQMTLRVDGGGALGSLIQLMVQRGEIQLFDSTGQPVRVRPS